MESLEIKKEYIKSDLQEIVASISPRYQSIAGSFFDQIAYLHVNCEKISTPLDKQGEDWHRELDNIVKELKSNINDIIYIYNLHLYGPICHLLLIILQNNKIAT